MPLGLLYLAARLEEAGHRVEVADLQLCRAPIFRLKEAIRRLDPMVVGVTSFSINLSKASRMLRTAKRCSEKIFTPVSYTHLTLPTIYSV